MIQIGSEVSIKGENGIYKVINHFINTDKYVIRQCYDGIIIMSSPEKVVSLQYLQHICDDLYLGALVVLKCNPNGDKYVISSIDRDGKRFNVWTKDYQGENKHFNGYDLLLHRCTKPNNNITVNNIVINNTNIINNKNNNKEIKTFNIPKL